MPPICGRRGGPIIPEPLRLSSAVRAERTALLESGLGRCGQPHRYGLTQHQAGPQHDVVHGR